MKPYKYIGIICIFAIISLLFSACSNDDYQLTENGKNVSVTFRPTLTDNLNTRAIGDATGINELVVTVYEETETLSKKFTIEKDWQTAKINGVNLTLIEGHTYNILFWAQNRDNTAYTITDDGEITVKYDNYKDVGFAKMEEMDAFYGVSNITVGSGSIEDKGITLTRPLAQLNFADNTTQPTSGTHSVEVTISNIPTSFNPFNDEVTTGDEVTFSFTDFPSEPLVIDGSDYYYLSCNYLFVPTSTNVSATLNLKQNGTTIEALAIDNITLEKNKKTNVLGAIVQQPETWSVWGGKIPTESTLTTDSENRYIIDEAADIAWLGANPSSLDENKTFVLTTNIDMAKKDGLSPVILPAGSIFDGGEHKIRGLKLNGGLFGDATDLKEIKDLTIDESEISGTTHVGVLVNTLKGSTTFTNVTVQNTSVSTNNGAAGGIVGYISRKDHNNRDETLTVTFDDCHVTETTIDGKDSEGHFVGLLRGYDNGETLTFKDNCTLTLPQAATVADDFVSPYTEGNEGAWLADNNYAKYNGWLGNEECYRGKVFYGNNRFIPRWDGKTTVAPLLVDGSTEKDHKYEVYSAFDLAGVRAKTASPAAIYLKENVDMFGHGSDSKYFVHSNFTKSAFNSTDDNKFNAFSSIALLEGNNKGIYNLALNANGSDRYAFILSGKNGDIHRNTSFHNCCTVVPHVVGVDDGQTVDNSYGATVVLSISGATYTMENVHAYGCKVFALQKTGIIAGRIVSETMATIKNSSVNNCYIENYDCKEHQQNFYNVAKFYSPGEIGGFIGFIENFATLENCHVKGTIIHAYGQNDYSVLFTSIPGRHVGQFIGDIRTSGDQKDIIKLTNCTVDSNTKCTQRWDKHKKCSMIGRVYYLNAWGIINIDTKGTVTLDNKSIF